MLCRICVLHCTIWYITILCCNYALMPSLPQMQMPNYLFKKNNGRRDGARRRKNLLNPLVISMWFTRCICNVTVCCDLQILERELKMLKNQNGFE